jgi:hypothetical protein
MLMTGFKPTCHPLLNCSGSRRRFAPTCQESLKRLRPILRSRLSQSSVDAENCKIPCETSGQFCGFSGGLSLLHSIIVRNQPRGLSSPLSLTTGAFRTEVVSKLIPGSGVCSTGSIRHWYDAGKEATRMYTADFDTKHACPSPDHCRQLADGYDTTVGMFKAV